MKKLALTLGIIFSFLFCFAQVNPNSHTVKGYYKSNGTYVQSYQRTNPNSTKMDNYSTYPNVNPYTGKTGTVKVDNYYSTPSYSTSSYSNSYSTSSYNNSYSTPSYNSTYSTSSYNNTYSTPSYSNTYSTPSYSNTYSTPSTSSWSNSSFSW